MCGVLKINIYILIIQIFKISNYLTLPYRNDSLALIINHRLVTLSGRRSCFDFVFLPFLNSRTVWAPRHAGRSNSGSGACGSGPAASAGQRDWCSDYWRVLLPVGQLPRRLLFGRGQQERMESVEMRGQEYQRGHPRLGPHHARCGGLLLRRHQRRAQECTRFWSLHIPVHLQLTHRSGWWHLVAADAAAEGHTIPLGLPPRLCGALNCGPWLELAEQCVPGLDRIGPAPRSLYVPPLCVPDAHLPAATWTHWNLDEDAKRLPMDPS